MGRTAVRVPFESLEPRRHLFAGDLDTTFSFDGKTLSDYAGQYDEAVAVATQSDSKIVVAAILSDAAGFSYFGAARYLGAGPNAGELDPTFGAAGTGFAITPINGSTSSIAIQPDGKVLLGGDSFFNGTDDFTVVRLTANGLLDPTFGQIVSGTTRAGFVRADFGTRDDYCRAIALQTDGSIVAVGNTQITVIPGGAVLSDFAVARFDTTGALDNTFSPGGTEGAGRARIDMGGSKGFARGVAIQPNGRIVVVGSGLPNPANTNASAVALARLTALGALDANFDADGRAYLVAPAATEGYAVGLQSDGKIVTLGGPRSNPTTMFLSRFNPDGSPAPLYDPPTNVLNILEGAQGIEPGGLVVQPDDRILASAWYYSTAADPKDGFVVVRREKDGSKGVNFSDPTYTGFAPTPDRSSGADAIALDPNGKIVAAGFTDAGGGITNLAVARYQNDLILPFNNHYAAVGETIEAENYNGGGQGVSYFDNTPANTGNANYRTDQAVDVDNIPGGGRTVRFETREATTYAFEVAADASYNLQARVASLGNAGLQAFVVRAGDTTPVMGRGATLDLPNTGGFDTYATLTFPGGIHLAPGRYFLYVTAQDRGVSAPTPEGGPLPPPVHLLDLDWLRVVNDTVPPQANFGYYEHYQAPGRLLVEFDEDVSDTLGTADVSVFNTISGAPVTITGFSVSLFSDGLTAYFDLPTPLPKGRYRAVFNANGIRDFNGNPLDGNHDGVGGDNYAFDFYFMPGDANGDAKVDFNDLVKIAQNYNAPGTKYYYDGDFNFDKTVNFNDLVILAQNYNTNLPPAQLAALADPIPLARTPFRPGRPIFSLLSQDPPSKLAPAAAVKPSARGATRATPSRRG